MKIGDLIQKYRAEHDMSQRQFATMCGLSNGYISMLEKDKNPKTGQPVTPTLPKLKALADCMGMSLMEIFELVDDMPLDMEELANYSGSKMSAPASGDGQIESLDMEIASLILRLSPEKKREAVSYLRYLAESADS